MASINKLSIRGVRAFSPEDDEQAIEFFFPVTIIVGANGCGKTTIIECLKYAVTGSMPPGKNAGQSFVHDPKSCGHTVVKANVKLRFTDRAGRAHVCVRSMELTQKKTTMTFKSLDGVMRTRDPTTGQTISLSHKCSELDKQIPNLVGVSKAILEHVVFCHQEDSSWPLQDSASVKKRFDEIFDSQRYSKALKTMQDIKKKYTAIAKDHKATVMELGAYKNTVVDIRHDLEEEKTKLEDLEDGLEKVTAEWTKIEGTMKEYAEIQEQVDEVGDRIDKLETTISLKDRELQASQRHLKGRGSSLAGEKSVRELKDMLGDFEEEMQQKADERIDLENTQKKLSLDIQRSHKEESRIMGDKGKLEAHQDQKDRLMRRRLITLEKIASDYAIDLSVTQQSASQASVADGSTVDDLTDQTTLSISDRDLKAFIRLCKNKQDELSQRVSDVQRQFQQQEDELSTKLNDLTAKKSFMETNKAALEQKRADGENEFKGLASKRGGKTRPELVADAKSRMEQLRKLYKEKSTDSRKTEIGPEIQSTQDKIAVLKRKIGTEQRIAEELKESSVAQQELGVLKDQVKKDVEALSDMIEERSFEFHSFNIELPNMATMKEMAQPSHDDDGQELVDMMQELETKAESKLDATQTKLHKLERDVRSKEKTIAEKSGLLAHDKKTLRTTKQKIADIERPQAGSGWIQFRKIVSTLLKHEEDLDGAELLDGEMDDENPESVLSYLANRLDEVEKAAVADIQPEVLQSVMQAIKNLARPSGGVEDIRCPCCQTTLEEVEDVRRFMDSMKKLASEDSIILKMGKTEADKNRELKKSYQTWRKDVQLLMGEVMEYRRLKGTVEKLSTSVEELEAFLGPHRTELDELKQELNELEPDMRNLRSIQSYCQGWAAEANRVASKISTIHNKNLDLSLSMNRSASSSGDRDLRTVEASLQEMNSEKDTLSEKLTKLQNEQAGINENIASISQRLQTAQDSYQKMEARFRDEQKSQVRREELSKHLHEWEKEIRTLSDEIRKLRPAITKQTTERERHRSLGRQEQADASRHLNAFKSEMKSLEEMNSQIRGFDKAGTSREQLEELNERLGRLKGQVKERQEKLKELEPQLKAIVKAIDDQEDHKKLIQENILVLNLQDEIKKLNKEKATLMEELDQIEGHDTVSQNVSRARQRQAQLKETRAQFMGRRSGHVEQIRNCERKLRAPEHRNIDDRHRVAQIKKETTEIAVKDLDKYANALDKALLRFHSMKIAEINKIIKELWMLTYKGQDIGDIEVVSGADGGGSKKSYNYRVVMNKGGTQLDMRGRCSAGQRVLASIVIRLALAETFCVNCGIIALDEPTVNLDYANKKGLAIALAQIIAHRAKQRNFQLVVITHDEDFVGMMKNEMVTLTGFDMPERYFQVRREESIDGKFYSKIDSVDWDELT